MIMKTYVMVLAWISLITNEEKYFFIRFLLLWDACLYPLNIVDFY